MKNQRTGKAFFYRWSLVCFLAIGFIVCGCGSSGSSTPEPAPTPEGNGWTFVDGNGVYGINKNTSGSADYSRLTVFNSKLYATWTEDNNTTGNQIRVAVYNGSDASPVWTFVDGNTASGINKDSTRAASRSQLTVFNEKLYAIWDETNGTAKQVRVAVYGGDDASPSWTFVDGNAADGINKDVAKDGDYAQLIVLGTKLYALWRENNGTADQIRAAVYGGDDASPTWSFVDGNGVNGINYDSTQTAYYPRLEILNSQLYATWKEESGPQNNTVAQIRVAVYNGDDANPAWTFVDGNTTHGINKDDTKNAGYPYLAVFDSKLYATWQEFNENTAELRQIRVAVYNGDDASPSWTFVDGNAPSTGINYDSTKFGDSPKLTDLSGALYATWHEDSGTVYTYDTGNTVEVTEVRVALYNGDDASPSWSFVDGDTASGLNKDSALPAYDSQLTVFDSELYASWTEFYGTAYQVRVAVKQ